MSETPRHEEKQPKQEIPKLGDFHFPTEKELNEPTGKELIELSKNNHHKLIELLSSGVHIPCFGLHGTTNENLDAILRDKKGHTEISTFYERPSDPVVFLADLYVMCDFVRPYAFSSFNRQRKGSNPGGVLIFNLESEKRKNITFSYEPLKGGSPAFKYMFYEGSTPEEVQAAEKFAKLVDNNQERSEGNPFPQRSGLTFTEKNFNTVFKGAFAYNQVKKYYDAQKGNMNSALIEQLLIQNILVEYLAKLGVIEKEK